MVSESQNSSHLIDEVSKFYLWQLSCLARTIKKEPLVDYDPSSTLQEQCLVDLLGADGAEQNEALCKELLAGELSEETSHQNAILNGDSQDVSVQELQNPPIGTSMQSESFANLRGSKLRLPTVTVNHFRTNKPSTMRMSKGTGHGNHGDTMSTMTTKASITEESNRSAREPRYLKPTKSDTARREESAETPFTKLVASRGGNLPGYQGGKATTICTSGKGKTLTRPQSSQSNSKLPGSSNLPRQRSRSNFSPKSRVKETRPTASKLRIGKPDLDMKNKVGQLKAEESVPASHKREAKSHAEIAEEIVTKLEAVKLESVSKVEAGTLGKGRDISETVTKGNIGDDVVQAVRQGTKKKEIPKPIGVKKSPTEIIAKTKEILTQTSAKNTSGARPKSRSPCEELVSDYIQIKNDSDHIRTKDGSVPKGKVNGRARSPFEKTSPLGKMSLLEKYAASSPLEKISLDVTRNIHDPSYEESGEFPREILSPSTTPHLLHPDVLTNATEVEMFPENSGRVAAALNSVNPISSTLSAIQEVSTVSASSSSPSEGIQFRVNIYHNMRKISETGFSSVAIRDKKVRYIVSRLKLPNSTGVLLDANKKDLPTILKSTLSGLEVVVASADGEQSNGGSRSNGVKDSDSVIFRSDINHVEEPQITFEKEGFYVSHSCWTSNIPNVHNILGGARIHFDVTEDGGRIKKVTPSRFSLKFWHATSGADSFSRDDLRKLYEFQGVL